MSSNNRRTAMKSTSVPVSKKMDANANGKTVNARVEFTGNPWMKPEALKNWPHPEERGVTYTAGPGGPALRFTTGYAIYQGIAPAGTGEAWTLSMWLRPDEPYWGVFRRGWSRLTYEHPRPVLVKVGTFLSSAWEVQLCQQRLEFHIGSQSVASDTRLKVGRWTHVVVVRDGKEIRLYVDGCRQTLRPPRMVNPETGKIEYPPSDFVFPPFTVETGPKPHSSDAKAKRGHFPILVLGHCHHWDEAMWEKQFVGAIGSLRLENRVWSEDEIAKAADKGRTLADKLSIRYSVLTDPVGGYSLRPDRAGESTEAYLKRMAWFHKAKYGLFLHWSPSSVKGIEISWGRGSNITEGEYDKLYKQFNPTKFNPRQWVAKAEVSGMKYVVMNVKHHEGFCMWPTKTTAYNISNTPYGKDITVAYVRALREAKLGVGLYFSPRDWWWKANRPEITGTPDQREKLVPYIAAQLKELCSDYGPIDLFWFDGGIGGESEMYRDIIGPLQPKCITNDRNGPGDYVTPEGQVPIRPLINPNGSDMLWETCHLAGGAGWSYHFNPQPRSYAELIRELVEVCAKGGNLLRNFGPEPSGEFPASIIWRLEEIGEWLKKNGESIYGTHRTRFGRQNFGWTTANDTTLYLHIIDWPGSILTLEGLSDKVADVRLLAGSKNLRFKQSGDILTIQLPMERPDPVDTVVAVGITR